MQGREAGEKYVNEKGDSVLSVALQGCALAFIPSLPVAFVVLLMVRIGGNRQPPEIKIWAITFVVMSIAAAILMLGKRDNEIRAFAAEWDEEQARQAAAAEKHRLEQIENAKWAAIQAERNRLAEIEHAQLQKKWEREQAAQKAAEGMAALENKVRVLWADFQATHNFTGEIPAEVMQQRFNAEIRRRLTAQELARLNSSQNREVARLIGG